MQLPEVPRSAIRAAGVAIVVASVLVAGLREGLPTAILVLSGWALLSVILLFWQSVQRLTGEADLGLEDALGLAEPTAAEERKRAVLRALKDLEYEREVGKIGEADYRELSARYRAEARQLLAEVDTHLSEGRRRAELLLEQRRRAQAAKGSEEPRLAHTGPPPEPGLEAQPEGAARPMADQAPGPSSSTGRAALLCPECGTPNDADARFCKGCGASLAAEAR